MGRDSNKKTEVRHRRKLFNGMATADEVHRQAIGGRCPCGLPAAIRIRSFAPADDLIRDNMAFLQQLAAQNRGQIPVVIFKGASGQPVKFVRVGMAYACDLCKSTAEKEAAKHPSGWQIEIDRGPGPDNPIVAVV